MRKKLKLLVYILLTVVAIIEFITGGDRGTDSTCGYSNIDGQEENARHTYSLTYILAIHTRLYLDKNVTLRLKAVHSWCGFLTFALEVPNNHFSTNLCTTNK